MSEAETKRLEEIIDAMGYEEKVVAVHSIPTEILEGELSRRSSRDRERKELIKNLVENMEKY